MDTIFDLLIQDDAFTGVAVSGMAEPDVALALQQPWVSIDNDSSGVSPEGILGREHSHPRAYGTFPRILRKYVREEHKLTLEDAIRKFSALPAQRLRLEGRGLLRVDMWADVTIFDPATIRDVATFENPNQLSQGIDYVLVNGVPVIDTDIIAREIVEPNQPALTEIAATFGPELIDAEGKLNRAALAEVRTACSRPSSRVISPAVSSASAAFTFTSGSTPTSAQSFFEKGLMAFVSGMPIPK